MSPTGSSGIVRGVDLRIAIEMHRIDPPEGSIRRERDPHGGKSAGQPLAFAGWLELLVLLQSLVESDPDQTAG